MRESAVGTNAGEQGPRLLRGRAMRTALWLASDGRCALCGGTLDPGWHADHRLPWSLTHRTNVHEMQALCATCNCRKGARV